MSLIGKLFVKPMPESYVLLPKPDVPKEQKGNVIYGIIGHLGSPVAYVVLLAILGVTLWNAIGLFLAVSVVFMTLTLVSEHFHASIELPKLNLKDIIGGLAVVFWQGLIVGGGFITLGWYGLHFISPYGPELSNSWWLIVPAVFLTDFAFYSLHRWLGHGVGHNPAVKFYRKSHSAHHMVSELDFMRGNQSSLIDVALSQFQPSLIIISFFLGMDLPSVLVTYGLILMLQATDHTSVTFNIGWLKYFFMDNHAHKFHHCKRGNLINHAAAFSIFDRMLGTYYEDWDLSSNYLHHHRIPLPIKRKLKPGKTKLKSSPVSA